MLAEAQHDFYHFPCYAELSSATCDGGTPKAFFDELDTGQMLIPFLVRNLPTDISPGTSSLDAISPYGYSCPIFTSGISDTDAIKGIRNFIEFGRDAGLVTSFIRLHPLLNNRICPALYGDRHIKQIIHGETVSIDLTLEIDELDKRLRRNHRQNIRKLKKLGFSMRQDDWEDYPAFIEIYYQTMRRCGADAEYFFDLGYFERLKNCLGTSLHICSIVSADGEVVSGGLFVKTGDIVQAHLSATSAQYLALAPSKLMFFEMRNWAKQEGATRLHLGGGKGGKRDSLFLFKKGIGTDVHHYEEAIGIVHDLAAYETLNQRWVGMSHATSFPETEYFPQYRFLMD